LLENCGIAAVAIHGRTRSQGYSGQANWEVIGECAEAVGIPVIGNGDLASGADVARRKKETRVSGAMIGRAAMAYPWVFREARSYLETGVQPPPVAPEERWQWIHRHAKLAVGRATRGDEAHTMMSLRSRFMAYTKGMAGGKHLRARFTRVSSLMELEEIAADHLDGLANPCPDHDDAPHAILPAPAAG
jgi:tRNA-dihydrouridine synthase B